MEPEKEKSELLTVRDVAELLSISTRGVHRQRDAGRIPQPIRLGGSIRWQRAKLMEWLDAGCPATRPARPGK